MLIINFSISVLELSIAKVIQLFCVWFYFRKKVVCQDVPLTFNSKFLAAYNFIMADCILGLVKLNSFCKSVFYFELCRKLCGD